MDSRNRWLSASTWAPPMPAFRRARRGTSPRRRGSCRPRAPRPARRGTPPWRHHRRRPWRSGDGPSVSASTRRCPCGARRPGSPGAPCPARWCRCRRRRSRCSALAGRRCRAFSGAARRLRGRHRGRRACPPGGFPGAGQGAELVVRSAEGLLPEPQGAQGRHPQSGESRPSELGAEEPLLERRVAGHYDSAVEAGEELGCDLGEGGGLRDRGVGDPVDEHRSGVATFGVDQGGELVLDAAVGVDAGYGDLDDPVAARRCAARSSLRRSPRSCRRARGRREQAGPP